MIVMVQVSIEENEERRYKMYDYMASGSGIPPATLRKQCPLAMTILKIRLFCLDKTLTMNHFKPSNNALVC